MSDPSELISDLCARYGVPRAFGEKLRPLLQRAQKVEPEPRQRILDLVTRSFAEEARRMGEIERVSARLARLEPNERKVLHTVAAVLHGWSPPGWLLSWIGREAG